jgi:hypothetical protein
MKRTVPPDIKLALKTVRRKLPGIHYPGVVYKVTGAPYVIDEDCAEYRFDPAKLEGLQVVEIDLDYTVDDLPKKTRDELPAKRRALLDRWVKIYGWDDQE